MKHKKLIVTIAIGEKYFRTWKKSCEKNWQQYADQHGYDLLCIDRPLDTSTRAQQRSPAWQKCLILSQDFSQEYERIVWVDSDILINTISAPDIITGVPVDKVGAVDEWRKPTREIYAQTLARMYESWKTSAIKNPTAQEYYTAWGLPDGFDEVVQCGVLVLSPQHHRHLLETTYYGYEEKGGREWHMEMRPLSYELLKAKAVHWIDYRFNLMWVEQTFLYYPFLMTNPDQSRLTKMQHMLGRALGLVTERKLKQLCLTNMFLNTYFLHFGGGNLSDMEVVDLEVKSFLECIL